MKNHSTNPATQFEAAEGRAVSPFVHFIEASFFAEIFRREAIPLEAHETSEAGPSPLPPEPLKVKRAAAGAQR